MIPKAKIRGYEVAKGWEDKDVRLPEQATADSAGFDFFAAKDVTIAPEEIELVPTGIKAYCRPNEFLLLANRSSNPRKGLILANGVGVVDSDFAGNPKDDGHIQFLFLNRLKDRKIVIKKGDKLGQGVFLNYLHPDNEGSTVTRTGGWGSTDATK